MRGGGTSRAHAAEAQRRAPAVECERRETAAAGWAGTLSPSPPRLPYGEQFRLSAGGAEWRDRVRGRCFRPRSRGSAATDIGSIDRFFCNSGSYREGLTGDSEVTYFFEARFGPERAFFTLYAMQSISISIPGVWPRSLPTVVLTGYGREKRRA